LPHSGQPLDGLGGFGMSGGDGETGVAPQAHNAAALLTQGEQPVAPALQQGGDSGVNSQSARPTAVRSRPPE
jgi:hypothetical protein